MKKKLSLFGVAVLAVMLVVTTSLWAAGQGRRDANLPIPDLIGTWDFSASGYFFLDVIHPTDPPMFFEDSGGDFIITDQTGRVFAGIWDGGESKVTGVILPDGTVSFQAFELTELRFFGTGSISVGGNTPEISGFIHAFDDFGALPPSDRNMASGFFLMVKQ